MPLPNSVVLFYHYTVLYFFTIKQCYVPFYSVVLYNNYTVLYRLPIYKYTSELSSSVRCVLPLYFSRIARPKFGCVNE